MKPIQKTSRPSVTIYEDGESTLDYIRRTWRRSSTQLPRLLPTGEKNRVAPALRYIPKISSFLGYNPLDGMVETVGEKIKQYRRKRGLSIKKLAKVLGIDPTIIARWEKGESAPGLTMKLRLKRLFDIFF